MRYRQKFVNHYLSLSFDTNSREIHTFGFLGCFVDRLQRSPRNDDGGVVPRIADKCALQALRVVFLWIFKALAI